jgi:hypothetical protein
MRAAPQISIYDRLLFIFYHLIAIVFTFFSLTYFSLPQPSVLNALRKMADLKDLKIIASDHSINPLTIIVREGDVRVYEDDLSGSERDAVLNEVIKEGYTVETNEESTALLSFGKGYKCLVRLLPETKLKIEKLLTLKADGTKGETSLFYLFNGQIIVQLSNLPPEANVDFKTKLSRYSPGASVSAMATDSETFAVLAVKNGTARAENLKSLKFEMILAGENHLVDVEGHERKSSIPEVLTYFEWDIRKHLPQKIDFQEILSLTGGSFEDKPVAQVDSAQLTGEAIKILEDKISLEMMHFRDYSTKLRDEILSGQEGLTHLRRAQEKETLRIQADINCLETASKCDLYSEKLLLSRGFPRLHHSARMSASIIKDLRLYLEEQKSKADEKQKEIEELIKLERKRSETMSWVLSRKSDKAQLNDILSRLQDQSLLR